MATKRRRRRKVRSNIRPRYTVRVNPKRRKRRKSRRKNAWYGNRAGHAKAARKGWKRRKRRNPARAWKGGNLYTARVNPRRRRNRRRRRNPNAMKRIQAAFSRKWIMQTATIGGGIMAGFLAMPFVYRMVPDAQKRTVRPFLGLFHVLAGSLLFGFVKNKAVKEIGVILAGTGVYDLVAYNVDTLGLPALPTENIMVTKLLGAPAAATPPAPVSANFEARRGAASRIARGLPKSPIAANFETQQRRALAANFQPAMMGSNWGYSQFETDDPYAGVFDGF